ncbi:MAG TPA: hypothetical protein ENJ32_02990, partial [Crenotrichaceae bacterium]|nr:hypothetical protein [Crenotrichaceae bacterium]
MDTLTFISNTIGQLLSWPVAVAGVALLFRGPIAERLKDVRKIKTKHFEADFGEKLEEAEAKITSVESEILNQSPNP